MPTTGTNSYRPTSTKGVSRSCLGCLSIWGAPRQVLMVHGVGGRSGCGCEFDGVAELFELVNEVFAATFWLVASGELVGAEFFVDGVI